MVCERIQVFLSAYLPPPYILLHHFPRRFCEETCVTECRPNMIATARIASMKSEGRMLVGGSVPAAVAEVEVDQENGSVILRGITARRAAIGAISRSISIHSTSSASNFRSRTITRIAVVEAP